MTRARTLWVLPCVLAAMAGCAGSGSLLSPQTTVGSLKASVSHLEYENQQLRRQVATVEKENRQVENRLVQEEALTGELHARLDDARTLIGHRDSGAAASATDVDPGPEPPAKTLPAGRTTRKGRKPPFAQIPGRIDTVPPATDDDGDPPRDETPTTSSRWRVDPGPQSRNDDMTVWLPVARGATDATPPRR
jgi:hypothetical protein